MARGVLQIDGWAATPGGPCSRVELTLDGRPIGRARLGGPRPDVHRATGLPAAAVSGFSLAVDLAEMGSEEQGVELGGHGIGVDGLRVPLRPVRIEVRGNEEDQITRRPARLGWVHQTVSRRQLLLPFRRRQRSAPLRILICAHNLGYGGAQLVLVELLRRLCHQHPIEGVVLAFGEGPVRRSFEELGFDVRVSPASAVSSEAEYEAWMEELGGWARSHRCDVALVNTVVAFPGADLALRLGLPTAWAIHESYPPRMLSAVYFERADPNVRARAQEALSAADALVFVCQATRACYEPHLPSARCLTLPYGVDTHEFDRWRAGFDAPQERRAQQIPQDATVVLCVGPVVPQKGQIPLIQAFAQIADRHPGAILRLVGSLGDDLSRPAALAAAAHGVQDRVRIEPVTPDVRPSYATADLLVSASDVESLPLSMVEAMALEVPVLGPNIFGIPELIKDGQTGWLCEPRDVLALAGALDRVLTLDAHERAGVAATARLIVEQEHRSDVRSLAWGRLLYELSDG